MKFKPCVPTCNYTVSDKGTIVRCMWCNKFASIKKIRAFNKSLLDAKCYHCGQSLFNDVINKK